MIIPNISELNSANCRKCSFEKLWPEFYDYLQNKYPNLSLSEQLYMYYNNLTSVPVCVICGKPTKFINFKQGWRRTCCKNCAGKDLLVSDKRKQTCLERYGVENVSKSEIIKEKSKQTCLERYGIENGGWSENAKLKIKNTIKNKYGTDWVMQNDEIKEKSRNTFQNKYGVKWNSQIDNIKEQKRKIFEEKYGGIGNASDILKQKQIKTCLERYGVENCKQKDLMITYPDLISFDKNQWIMKCPHPECNKCESKTYITNGDLHRSRMRINCELCTNLFPKHSLRSTYELDICNLLDSLNIKYETNVRGIINDYELDIYIPDKKIAFEINGCYWHSSEYKSPHYHEIKTSIALTYGIRLYHIWEDWWITKNDIIKSMIMNWVGMSGIKIYARKCEIREVNRIDGMNFLENNHIQGKSPYEIGFGLYYNNKLVSLMTFGHKRGCVGKYDYKGKEDEWELIRFCSLLHTNVIGGASKLLKKFIEVKQPDNIYSYASRDISIGQLYNTLGFVSDGNITSSYWYIEPNTFKRYHRSSFTKDAIVKKGWKESKEGWTEAQAMNEKGFYRIYDAGQTKWIYKNKKPISQ